MIAAIATIARKVNEDREDLRLTTLFVPFVKFNMATAVNRQFLLEGSPLNNDNDLLAADLLLADDFPTYDFSFQQIVADFSPNIAAVLHGTKSTGPKTKTTTLIQRARRSSRRSKISCDFKRRYRRAGGENK